MGDWNRRAQTIVGGVVPGRWSGGIKKTAQAMRNKSVMSVPSWILHQFLS